MSTLSGSVEPRHRFVVRSMIAAVALGLSACGGSGPSTTAQSSDAVAPNGGGSAAGNGTDSGIDNGTGTGSNASDVVKEAVARLTDVGAKRFTYIVSAADGDDANDGLSVEKPFKTLERALRIVGPGDTIELRAGIYTPKTTFAAGEARENGFYLRAAGTAGAKIKLKPYNNEKAIVDAGDRDFAFYVFARAAYWIIEGLEIRGGGPQGYTVKIDSHHVNLVNNNIHGSMLDIIKLVQTSDDVVIFGNEIHHPDAQAGANSQGIDIVGADRVWIAHNYVHDIRSIAMYAKGNARNAIFENNRVERINSRAIMLGQSTDSWLLSDGVFESYDGIIRNNVIIDTDDACIATASSYNVKIYNNSCYNVAKLRHGAIFVSNESMLETPGENVEIKNNIVVIGSARPAVKIGPGAMADISTLRIDRNMYSRMDSGAVTFLSEDHALFNVDIAAWTQRLHLDGTSMLASPKYASVETLLLQDDSPAINAGIATDVVTDDFRHAQRPLGDVFDIGAYEMR